jgi:hypothetical protein
LTIFSSLSCTILCIVFIEMNSNIDQESLNESDNLFIQVSILKEGEDTKTGAKINVPICFGRVSLKYILTKENLDNFRVKTVDTTVRFFLGF